MYQFAFRSFVLLCFCNFWSPALLSSYAYVNFFKLALVNHANYSHGAPKWIAAYAQRLLLDLAVQVFFFFLVFWHSVSHGMALLLVFLLEMVHVLTYLRSILQLLGLANSTPVTLLASKTLVPLTALVIRYHIFPALATRAKWAKLVQLPAARTVARYMISHQLQAARRTPQPFRPSTTRAAPKWSAPYPCVRRQDGRHGPAAAGSGIGLASHCNVMQEQ
ncbi:hypothetical protein PF011_g19750 [Phytophthora fragariae]|nr:hypothetical protein PF011_g19750 [Phytophthora fragariae]